jgi:hypothetical protein
MLFIRTSESYLSLSQFIVLLKYSDGCSSMWRGFASPYHGTLGYHTVRHFASAQAPNGLRPGHTGPIFTVPTYYILYPPSPNEDHNGCPHQSQVEADRLGVTVYKCITTSSGNVFSADNQLLDTKEEKEDKYASTIFRPCSHIQVPKCCLEKAQWRRNVCTIERNLSPSEHEALKNLCSDRD